jgi:(E)-4-hydroxy-3-methylbut-2-enyl-diphosphate synthase
MTERKQTRRIMLGRVPVGDGAPVTVQSMTNTDTRDLEETLDQVRHLAAVGCDIVRVAVPDAGAAEALPAIIAATSMPVVADIHFDHRLALLAIETGVAGIRINPGTIGKGSGLAEVAAMAAERGVVVRVGVNSGSLERRLRDSHGRAEASALAKSALEGVALLERMGVSQIKVSVKASDVPRTIEAYRIVSRECSWPLHVGVTEAGTLLSGAIKSAVGIGALLSEGIGDTMRVSLTASPVEEVRIGKKILASLGLREDGPEVIACPTCARTEIDVIGLATELEKSLEGYRTPITVAVMGCVVNGPGEAREADIGIAGEQGGGVLFIEGEKVRRIRAGAILEELLGEVKKMIAEREKSGGSG